MKKIKKENAVMICVIALIAALSVFFVVSMKKNAAKRAAEDTTVTAETSSAGTTVSDEPESVTADSTEEDNKSTDTTEEAAPDSDTDAYDVISEETVTVEPVTPSSEPEKSASATGREETKKAETTEKKGSAETRTPEKTTAPVTSSAPARETEPALACTISIRCDRVLDNMDRLEEAKIPYVPSDGWILHAVSVGIEEGESVFDVLRRVCDEYGIQLEFSWTPIYNSSYIEGIGYLYEFDCGDESGWIYKVNGKVPNYGCSEYKLYGGESIVWSYSCEGYGADVGAEW